ncbi:MAG: endonuclease/exonuclease/phosphatase family protein [Fusobacteriaceae bacterium]
MKKLKFIGTLVLLLLYSINSFSEEVFIASFNTLRLGVNKKDYNKMAKILKNFKLIGLVEVMNENGIEELVDNLEKETGVKWEYNLSPYKVGKSSYKEFYGFVWEAEKVQLIKEIGFYPDLEKVFTRPPYGAYFKIDKFDFVMVLAHSVFGKKESYRRAEAFNYDEVYNYFQETDKNEKDIIIAGDFNLPGHDEAFEQMTKGHKDKIIYAIDPLLKTTIGLKSLSSSYDNMFLSSIHTKEFTGKSGTYDFTNGDYKKSREFISDHLPIFIVIETGEDDD